MEVVEDSTYEVGTQDRGDGEDAGDDEVFRSVRAKVEERGNDKAQHGPGDEEADCGSGDGFG
jgi:hypothetical protein